jgi:hypothetical protein
MSRIARWLLTLSVALIALFATFGSAAAAPRAADDPPTDAKPRLERAYKEEKLRLATMERRFQEASAFAEKVAGMIATLKEHGVDTARLQRALEAFRARMGDAHHQWEAARDVLATHAGFDNKGHVTDPGQARATLMEAHTHLMRARSLADRAFHDLRAVLAAFSRPVR